MIECLRTIMEALVDSELVELSNVTAASELDLL